MSEYIIKIDINNTEIYKIDYKNESLIKQNDDTGSFIIPTALYFYENDENILYGNEALTKIYQNNFISDFLLLLNVTYSQFDKNDILKNYFIEKNIEICCNDEKDVCNIKINHNNSIIFLSIKDILCYFLNYIIKLIKEYSSNDKNIKYKIIIPYHLTNYKQNILLDIYKEILNNNEHNSEDFDIIVEKIINFDSAYKEIFIINIQEYNTIIDLYTNKEKYDMNLIDNCGLNYLKQKLFNIVKQKLITCKNYAKIKNNNEKDDIKIKKYINSNLKNMLETLIIKPYNIVLELNDIYQINLIKTDIENIISYMLNVILNNIKKYNFENNYCIKVYDNYLDILLKLTNLNNIKNEISNIDPANNIFKLLHNFNYLEKTEKEDYILNSNLDSNTNILSTSLGIGLENGLFCRFINKNTKIPYEKTKIFTYKKSIENVKLETYERDNEDLKISFYKGNNLYVKNNLLLHEIVINSNEIKDLHDIKIKIKITIDNLEYFNIIIEYDNKTYIYNNICINLNKHKDIELSDSEDEFQCIENI